LNLDKPLFPQPFKGIAIFTPGGDLIYSIDPTKQEYWHLHLCAGLQELLGLPEPPHFLVPGYTATIDRWFDPQTRQLRTSAEIYQPVRHHQALLNAVFGTSNMVWQVAPWQEESCDPMVLETYRHQFPQLWEEHDLVVRFERSERFSYPYPLRERYRVLRESRRGRGMVSAVSEVPPEGFYANGDAGSLEAAASRPVASTSYAANTNIAEASERSHSDSEEISPDSQSQRAQGYVLRLFVSGHSAATEHTLKGLHQLLEDSLRHPYTLKVIDIFKHPDQAEANQISATPTLLRVWPEPVRRIVGDLNDVETVLRVLAAPEV